MISLPLMNNLCKRWVLPQHIQAQCDHYFLRNISDTVLAGSLVATEQGMFIQDAGVNFQVIFMYDAAQTYSQAQRWTNSGMKEPNYWCSFRSLSFEWNGVTCTKSYVLIQVDKGKETKDLIGVRAPKAPETGEKKFKDVVVIGAGNYRGKLPFTSFAERSQPIEKDESNFEEKGGLNEEV